MLISIVGLQDQFIQWCEGLVTKAMEQSSRSLLISQANSSEVLVDELLAAHPIHNVLVSHWQQNTWLDPILAKTNGRCILAITDPRSGLAKHVSAGADLLGITRSIANACASLTYYMNNRTPLVVRAEDNPANTARSIVDYLNLPIDDHDIAAALSSLSQFSNTMSTVTNWEKFLNPEHLDLINGLLQSYVSHFSGNLLGAITWHPNLFLVGDTAEPYSGPINITGGPYRCLIFGPYLYLPPGHWSAEIPIAFTDVGGVKDFIIDVATTEGRLNETVIRVDNEGAFRVNLPFVVNPGKQPALEIHVNCHHHVQGRLALGKIILKPDKGSPVELLDLLNSTKPTENY